MAEMTDTERKLVGKVRKYLRDYRHLNRVVDGVNHLDEMILEAIDNAVEDWNTTPPLTAAVTIVSHPAPFLLVQRAAIQLLDELITLATVNELPVSDVGGVAMSSAGLIQLMERVRTRIAQEYEVKKGQYKAAANLRAALRDRSASVPSPYRLY